MLILHALLVAAELILGRVGAHLLRGLRLFVLASIVQHIGAVDALIAKGLLVKSEAGIVFESPFTRGWTIVYALPDAGIVNKLPF
jgi:hypothetical protein